MKRLLLLCAPLLLAIAACSTRVEVPVRPPLPAPRKPRVKLVVVSASWCGPCRVLHAALVAGRPSFAFEVLTDDREAIERYKPKAYPTLVILRDGVEVDRRVGGADLADLESWVGSHSR